MNGRRVETPERLLEGDATAFERRVLEQALARGPSKELTQRMAKALGVAVTTLAAPASAASTASSGATTKAGPAASTSTLTWVLVPAAVVALSVAGAMIGLRGNRLARPAAAVVRVEAPVQPSPAAPAVDDVPASVVSSGRLALPVTVSRPLAAPSGPDLSAEIALVDGARAALAEHAPGRALEAIRRYETRYPRGTFAQEATATKVEALLQMGRTSEARALALRFVAAYGGTLLGQRVAALAGLPHP